MLKVIKHELRKAIGKHRARGLSDQDGEIKLELGAGAVPGENGWVTVDWNKRCDVYWDLTDTLPFPDNRVTRIYTSHTLEHLTYAQSQGLLKECLRILNPGGEISICVPNARFYIDAYVQERKLEKENFHQPAWNYVTPIDYVNYTAYMDGEHKHLFDQENLVAIMKQAGFENAQARSFDAALDLPDRDYESIYAIASKPAFEMNLSDPPKARAAAFEQTENVSPVADALLPRS